MAAPPSSPSRPDREAALALAARRRVDVVVVGGGITGAGIALDAAHRGLSVVLVERDDVASGTSSKSSKLVHGGLRYLANGDVAMVAEGVRERGRLRRNAPHLVRPLRFVIPLDDLAMQLKLQAGLTLYDTMALGTAARRRRRLSVPEVRQSVPGLVHGFRRGGWLYDDCQTDDARLTLQIAQRARDLGALVVTHAAVEELRADGEGWRVTLTDGLEGNQVDLTTRAVVGAAGVWAGRVRGLADERDPLRVRPAKGVHLTFRGEQLPVTCAVTVPSPSGDGRHAFVVPWGEQVYVGTTDTDFTGPVDRPSVDAADANYLLAAVNAAFDTHLTADDAIGAWAGTRPLLEVDGASSKDLSRRHAVIEDPPGLVTVTGGKLTTYRQMAQDAVDQVLGSTSTGRDDRGRSGAARSRTVDLRLGVAGDPVAALRRAQTAATDVGLTTDQGNSLFHRHGDLAPQVARFLTDEPDGRDRLVDGLPYLRGEVRWSVRHELARSVDDVLQRRFRVSLRDAAAGGRDAIDHVADVLGEELAWDEARRRASVAAYLDAVDSERGVVPRAA